MTTIFHLLCPRYSGPLTPTVTMGKLYVNYFNTPYDVLIPPHLSEMYPWACVLCGGKTVPLYYMVHLKACEHSV